CGLAVVAGTGSMAYGKTADGRTARAGGWGSLLGDEGSAYILVTDALRAVAHAADGRGPATDLQRRFLDHLGLQMPQELITCLHGGGWDRAALAGLAPLVLEAAETGDAVAAELAERGAAELATAALSVV